MADPTGHEDEIQNEEPQAASAQATEGPLGLEEARSWIGFKVDEIGGATVGRVEGAFVDARDGSPSWLVIRLGRFGRRSVVPFDFVAGGIGHVWVPYGRDAIRNAPDFDPASGLDRELEIALCEHYGIPAGDGRRAVIEAEDDQAPTSVPAEAG